MHGMIMCELERYVETALGPGHWQRLLEQCGIGPRIYLPVETYPDEDIVRIVGAALEATGLQASVLLEGFGEFLVPTYLKYYGNLLNPRWRTLDVIENTEHTIHRVVRLRNPGASPPALKCERVGRHEVVITYNSPRRMCHVAVGICKGVAKQFGELITIAQPTCALRGDAACEIRVAVTTPTAHPPRTD